MDKEKEIMLKICENGGWMTTKVLDAILLEAWGDYYNAAMHCNYLMRKGLINYHPDGDWEVLFTKEDIENKDSWKNNK